MPWRWVAAVCGMQFVVLGWFIRRGWFFVDDFLFFDQARSPGSAGTFLRRSLFEHFSPVHRASDYLFLHTFGMSWTAAAVVLLALAAACTAAFAHLASGLIADRRVVVGAAAVYGLSLFFARVASWWTGGTHLLLLTLFSLVAFDGHVRWVRTRAAAPLVCSLVAYCLALLTHEQAMLLPAFLVLFRLLWLDEGSASVRRWSRTLWREAWVWLTYAGLTGAALTNFLLNYYAPQGRPTPGELARFVWISLAEGFAPTLVLLKLPEGQLGSLPVTVALGLTFLVAVVVVSVRSRQRAIRAWAFFGLAFLIAVVPLGAGRISQFGVSIGREPNYQTAPAFLFVLVVALLVSQPRRSVRTRASSNPRRASVGLAVATVTYATLLARTLPDVAVATESVSPRSYFTQLDQGLAAAGARGETPVLFDQVVPDSVVPGWLAPMNWYSNALSLVHPSLRINDGDAGYVVDDSGRLARVDFVGSATLPLAAPSVVGDCPAPAVPGGPLRLAVAPPLVGDDLLVRVRWSGIATGTVHVGGGDGVAHVGSDRAVGPGTTTFFTSLPLPTIADILVDAGPGTRGCVEEVVVGSLRPSG
jgi:hypothetical protein